MIQKSKRNEYPKKINIYDKNKNFIQKGILATYCGIIAIFFDKPMYLGETISKEKWGKFKIDFDEIGFYTYPEYEISIFNRDHILSIYLAEDYFEEIEL